MLNHSVKFFFFLIMPVISLTSNASVSTASFQVVGRVPEILSLKTESSADDLDLRPGVKSNRKIIGEIGLKLNTEIAGILVSSSTVSGVPENLSQEPFKFSKPFMIKVGSECQIFANTVFSDGVQLNQDGIHIKPINSDTNNGLDESCELSATWGSSSFDSLSPLKVHDDYSMSIIVSVVSL